MRRLVDEVRAYVAKHGIRTSERILFIPSYYMIPFTRLRDFVIALSLMARGVELVPIEFGTFHPDQCVLFGGQYGKSRPSDLREECRIESTLLRDILGLRTLQLSQFRTKEDREISNAYSLAVTFDNYETMQRDGYPIGEKAAHVTMNLNNVGQMPRSPQFLGELRGHVRNIVELQLAFNRAFDRLSPTSVLSNVPYYYRWGVPFEVARKRSIPFYSLGLAEKKNAVVFQRDTDQLSSFDEGWPFIRDRVLTSVEEGLIERAISLRKNAQTAHYQEQLEFAKAGDESVERSELIARLQPWKGKVVVFPVNVLCDAPVYQRCPAFGSLAEMLGAVLDFFRTHPQYHLVLKAHPGEKMFEKPHLKGTVIDSQATTLRSWIQKHAGILPSNVTFVEADTKIAALDIVSLSQVGICYSSSVALEMALSGRPMISTAHVNYQNKGLMLYPQSREEFFSLLTSQLERGESDATRARREDLARRYYLLTYGYGSIDWGLIQGSDSFCVEDRLMFDASEALLPGRNPALDFICDSIIYRAPLADAQRFPPLTGTGLPVGGLALPIDFPRQVSHRDLECSS